MSIGKLFFSVKIFQLKEELKILARHPSFFFQSFFFAISSFFFNPYRIHRRYAQKTLQDLGVYGETPLTMWEQLAKEACLQQRDLVLDLGSGKGKGCFFLQHLVKCEVWGYEKVAFFYYFSLILKWIFRKKKLFFFLDDMKNADFTKATFVYFFSTSLSTSTIESLLKAMQKLPQGAQILSVSHPLQADYLSLEKKIPVRFAWGKTIAYLHKVKIG